MATPGSSAHAEMRRRLLRCIRLRIWFLRSRGDAPREYPRKRSRAAVPPLTRRCARVIVGLLGLGGGSSAHAEMRRIQGCTPALRTRFLRSRGDAPSTSPDCKSIRTVPPLTRRCAQGRSGAGGAAAGSSAHAEMRRVDGTRSRRASRFLRSRGDAPDERQHATWRGWVPPLTRRCALRKYIRIERLDGSSAHAEMRRRASRAKRIDSGFLRSRGDAPDPRRRHPPRSSVPPLTRRCAVSDAANVRGRLGSSAHAEMRPPLRRGHPERRGFLRSRGDAPLTAEAGLHVRAVPPLTRRCAVRVEVPLRG